MTNRPRQLTARDQASLAKSDFRRRQRNSRRVRESCSAERVCAADSSIVQPSDPRPTLRVRDPIAESSIVCARRLFRHRRCGITSELTRRRESKHLTPHHASCERRSRRSRPTICSARSDIIIIDYRLERRSTRHAQTDKVAEASVIRMKTGSVARCLFSIAIRRRCAMVSTAKIPPDVMT